MCLVICMLADNQTDCWCGWEVDARTDPASPTSASTRRSGDNYIPNHGAAAIHDVLHQPVIAKEEAVLEEADYMFSCCEALDSSIYSFPVLEYFSS
nr:uncharacterized protein LOC109758750 isoform X2 [Aegilops tauschii subsp. strangulata]